MARRPRIDRELARYLVYGENVIVAVRQHWFSLIRPITAVVLATLLALWTDVNTEIGSGGQVLRNGTLLIFWASVGWLLWEVGNWRRDWFVATDKRFLLFYGFIRRRVAMMPLIKVTDMTFDRSLLARIIGYGNFVLESAGQEQALSSIMYVPDADRHYHEICTVLFGPGAPARIPPGYGYGPGSEGGPGGGGRPGRGGDDRGGPGRGSGGGPEGRRRAAPGGSPHPVGGPHREGGGERAAPREPGGPIEPEGEEPGPAVVVGPGQGGVRVGDPGADGEPEPESWYRSSNLDGPARLDDTGEIPVVRGFREDTDEVPLYPPRDWMA